MGEKETIDNYELDEGERKEQWLGARQGGEGEREREREEREEDGEETT